MGSRKRTRTSSGPPSVYALLDRPTARVGVASTIRVGQEMHGRQGTSTGSGVILITSWDPDKPEAPRQSAGDVVNLPDLSAERYDVGRPPDEFERGRLVQTPDDLGEPTLSIDLEQLAGVRVRR